MKKSEVTEAILRQLERRMIRCGKWWGCRSFFLADVVFAFDPRPPKVLPILYRRSRIGRTLS